MPAHAGIRLEQGEGVNTAGPNTVEPNPEQALVTPEARPSVTLGGKRCQLLMQREDLEVEKGAASEQAGEGGEQYGLHPPNAIALYQETSTKSASRRFVVRTPCRLSGYLLVVTWLTILILGILAGGNDEQPIPNLGHHLGGH